jgi:protein transport protein SEC24
MWQKMQVRPPMPPVFFFLIDVSMAAVSTGAVAAACSAVNRALADLTVRPLTSVASFLMDFPNFIPFQILV